MALLNNIAVKSLPQVNSREGGTGFEDGCKYEVVRFKSMRTSKASTEKGDSFMMRGINRKVAAVSAGSRRVHVQSHPLGSLHNKSHVAEEHAIGVK